MVWDDQSNAIVDPDAPKLTLPSLKEPKAPKPTDINLQKTIFSSLEEDEKEELWELRRKYRRKLNKHNRQQRAIGALRIKV